MEIKKKPEEIYAEYVDGTSFNAGMELYSNVKKNQRFFMGDQWYGVNAPDMTKPVFNIIKRVVSYFIAMLVSDDVGVHITPFDDTEENKALADVLAFSVEKVIERTKTTTKARKNIQNACVDGDTAVYISFDPDIETNQSYQGDIETEVVDNTHIIFGNPYTSEVQKQPYILVVQRLYTKQVKDMAKEAGVSENDISMITPDDDEYTNEQSSADAQLTTVITKFWKEKTTVNDKDQFGISKPHTKTTVKCIKVTNKVVLKEETDLEYKLYPIAWFSWEKTSNNYHGRSPITGLIPNQVFINKIYAMCMVYMTNMGFPRVFYDENKIAKLTNDVTKATAITNMDMAGKVIDAVKAPDFSNQIIQLIDSTIAYTKETMGASDAALGEIANPNNTSAIVSVQQASSVPLEIQKLDFYQFYEDIVRIIVDIMGCDYGTRMVKITESQAKALNLVDHIEYHDMFGNQVQPVLDPMTGQLPPDIEVVPIYKTYAEIDFSVLRNANFDLDVEIGQSSYWSEQTQVQTMDNLFDKGIVTNPITYLEGIPDKYIPNKRKLMDELKQQRAETERQQKIVEQQSMIPGVTRGMQDGQDNRASAGMYGNEQLNQVYEASKEFYGGGNAE